MSDEHKSNLDELLDDKPRCGKLLRELVSCVAYALKTTPDNSAFSQLESGGFVIGSRNKWFIETIERVPGMKVNPEALYQTQAERRAAKRKIKV